MSKAQKSENACPHKCAQDGMCLEKKSQAYNCAETRQRNDSVRQCPTIRHSSPTVPTVPTTRAQVCMCILLCASCYVHLAMCILLCASCCASYDLGIPSSPIRCPIGYPGRLSQRPSTSTSTTFASLIEHIRNGEEKKNLQLEHTKVKWQTLRADGNLRCRLHRARSALRYGPEREAPEMGLRAKRLKMGLS